MNKRKSALKWLGLVSLFNLAPAMAALNDTGQTLCHDGTQLSTCNELYLPQDGTAGRDVQMQTGQLIKTGIGAAGFDFTPLNSQGGQIASANDSPVSPPDCVRDNVSGLTWDTQTTQQLDLDQAAQRAAAFNTSRWCGFTDWRVPTLQELQSLVHAGTTAPAIDSALFPGVLGAPVWSNTADAQDAMRAWTLDFNRGSTSTSLRTDLADVLLVRGEATTTVLTDKADGTVTQAPSGLMWAKCSEGQNGLNCAGTPGTTTWTAALQSAHMSSLSGYNDWRLPNKKELESLADYTRHNPAIDTALFPNADSGAYWTATPAQNEQNASAWSVNFSTGSSQEAGLTEHLAVRLVRDEPSAATISGEAATGTVQNEPVVVAVNTNAAATPPLDASQNSTSPQNSKSKAAGSVANRSTGSCTASDTTTLSNCISGATAGTTINLTTNITLTGALSNINTSLTIDGHGYTVSGNSAYRVFWVQSGTVTIQNITIQSAKAKGGNGGGSTGGGAGGGGAGLGGAIFVQAGTVSLVNATLNSNLAQGGSGGTTGGTSDAGGGGGGGMAGDGSYAGGTGGAGGGSGNAAAGIGSGGNGGDATSGGNAGGGGAFGGAGGGGGAATNIFNNGAVGGSGGFGGGGGGGSSGVNGGGRGTNGWGAANGANGNGGFGGIASGGNGGSGAGMGGAIFAMTGTLALTNVAFSGNNSIAGTGGSGNGEGYGGAIFVCNNSVNGACSATVNASSCGVRFNADSASNAGSTDTNNADVYNVSKAALTTACAPVVTTNAASSVTNTTATLNGTVNGSSAATTVKFNYGTSISYGSQINATQSPIAANSGSVSVSANLTGLTCNTPYHYQVTATNSTGTQNGSDQMFTTTACKPTVTTNAAGNVTDVSATLNGSVSDGGANTTVAIEYGTDTNYGTPVTASPNAVSKDAGSTAITANLTGLTCNTPYHYRVNATNSAGTTNGSDQMFTTTACKPTVTTNAAGNVTDVSATLNGSVSDGGANTTVAIEYGTDTNYGTPVTASPNAVSKDAGNTSITANLTGLACNTPYHYRVNATNSAGTTNGSDMLFTTTACKPTVTTSAASSVTDVSATLNGSVSDGGADTTVAIEYGADTNYGTPVTASPSSVSKDAGSTAITANLTGLTCNTPYHYRLNATNSAGTTNGSDQTFTTTACKPTVTTSAASSVTDVSATLNGSVSDGGANTTVAIEYGTDTNYGTPVTASPNAVSKDAGSTAITANLTGLTCNTPYHYRVNATNSAGTTNGSDQMFTTTACKPTVTTNAAGNVTDVSATLNGSVSDGGANTTVAIEYGTDTNYGTPVTASPNAVSKDAGNTAITANLTGLACNTPYHYRLNATNSAGTTNGSDMLFTTTACVPSVTTQAATNIVALGATLNGMVNDGGDNTTVAIEYGTDTNYGTPVTASPSSVSKDAGNTSITANLTGLTCSTQYHYRVAATNGVGTISGSDQMFTTVPCPTSAVTGAATNPTLNGISLSGTVNVGANIGNTSAIFQYGVDTSYGNSIQASPYMVSQATNNVTVSTVIASGLACGTTYHYRLRAGNGGGAVYGSDQTFTTLACTVATTGSAGGIGVTSASLNGTIDVGAAVGNTTAIFQYGMSTEYGSTIQAIPYLIASGTSGISVSATIPSGLNCGTLYHYRLRGGNTGGAVYGSDQTFTTGACTIATTNAATNIATNGATLNGVINMGATMGNTSAVFLYGTTTSYGTAIMGIPYITMNGAGGSPPISIAANVSGLACGTLYHYQLKAGNASGTAYGNDQTVTTGACTTATTGDSSNVTTTTATLNGTVNVGGVAGSTSVVFQYGTTSVNYDHAVQGSPYSVGSGTNNVAVTGNLTGLTCGGIYHYRVKAGNSGGTVYGGDQVLMMAQCTMAMISAGAIPTINNGAILSGDIMVGGASNNTTAIFQYGLDTNYGSVIQANPYLIAPGSNITTVTATIPSGLACGTTYHYRLKAGNNGGTVYSMDAQFGTWACH